jgi:hypothetical protein
VTLTEARVDPAAVDTLIAHDRSVRTHEVMEA